MASTKPRSANDSELAITVYLLSARMPRTSQLTLTSLARAALNPST